MDTCQRAKEYGYDLVWVETCCIDKRSGTELLEVINLRYRWCGNAKGCYAYPTPIVASLHFYFAKEQRASRV